MATDTLFAGVGRCDITPAPGTPQGGWGAQTHQRGTGADMPLLVTALAMRQGEVQVLIIDTDSIGFDKDWTAKIVDAISTLTGVPHSNIRFSCSHTHAGPNTFRLQNITEGLNMATTYLESLPDRIAGAAWQALANLVPVSASAGTGGSAINRNRRVLAPDGETIVGVNEHAESDSTLGVIRLDREDGNVLCTIVHYACHPTTLGWQNTLFSPDYPGPMRQVVERELGGACLFLQGAAGDLGPRIGFTGDLTIHRQLGHELGLAAASLAFSLTTQPINAHFQSVMPSGANIAQYTYTPAHAQPLPLVMRTIYMRLPVRQLESEADLAAKVDALWQEVHALNTPSQTEQMRRAQARATQMGWRLANARLYAGKTHVEWQLQIVRIGNIALVSMPGEPFSSIGQRIRQASPFTHTFISGYSNGGFGYIPDREAYTPGGYEVQATPFSPDAADVVVDTALRALKEMF